MKAIIKILLLVLLFGAIVNNLAARELKMSMNTSAIDSYARGFKDHNIIQKIDWVDSVGRKNRTLEAEIKLIDQINLYQSNFSNTLGDSKKAEKIKNRGFSLGLGYPYNLATISSFLKV